MASRGRVRGDRLDPGLGGRRAGRDRGRRDRRIGPGGHAGQHRAHRHRAGPHGDRRRLRRGGGGAGVGAGLAFAEAAAAQQRVLALTAAGALGGGIVGAAVQWLTRWGLSALVGLDVQVGGGLEGVAIGTAAGLAFAIATRRTEDKQVAPRVRKRWQVALVAAVSCGLAGLALTLAGRPLAAGTIQAIADAAEGSRANLAPLGRLIGEPDLGPMSRAILGFCEPAAFGLGLAWALMRRPRRR